LNLLVLLSDKID